MHIFIFIYAKINIYLGVLIDLILIVSYLFLLNLTSGLYGDVWINKLCYHKILNPIQSINMQIRSLSFSKLGII